MNSKRLTNLLCHSILLWIVSPFNSFGQTKIDDIQIDYTKANTNDPKLIALQQVPKGNGVFVWLKGAGGGPAYIYEGRL